MPLWKAPSESLHGKVGFTSVYMGMLFSCQDTVYTDIINSEELNN